MEEGSSGSKEYTYRRPEQVTKLNDEAGYVTIKNTEANIKAIWKNLSSKVRGLLGKKRLKDSKQSWPSLLDREVSSDTEPDADVVPRYAVRKGTGPEIEVEWAIPVLQCSESEEATRELPTYPHLDEREYGTLHTIMAHQVNLELTHAYAGSLQEMTGNSALQLILQHDVGPMGQYGAFQHVTLYNNTVSVMGPANRERQILYRGRPTVPYDHILKRACGEVHQFQPCGPGLKCDKLMERSCRRMEEVKNQMARLHRILRRQLAVEKRHTATAASTCRPRNLSEPRRKVARRPKPRTRERHGSVSYPSQFMDRKPHLWQPYKRPDGELLQKLGVPEDCHDDWEAKLEHVITHQHLQQLLGGIDPSRIPDSDPFPSSLLGDESIAANPNPDYDDEEPYMTPSENDDDDDNPLSPIIVPKTEPVTPRPESIYSPELVDITDSPSESETSSVQSPRSMISNLELNSDTNSLDVGAEASIITISDTQSNAKSSSSVLAMRFAPGDSPNKKRMRLSPNASARSSSVSSSDSDEYYNAREDPHTPRGSFVEQVNQYLSLFIPGAPQSCSLYTGTGSLSF